MRYERIKLKAGDQRVPTINGGPIPAGYVWFLCETDDPVPHGDGNMYPGWIAAFPTDPTIHVQYSIFKGTVEFAAKP